MKSSQGSVEEQEELEEPVYEEPVYEEVGAFPELTKDPSATFSMSQSEALPATPKPFDPLLLSKASTLGLEEKLPEPPPSPPSRRSPPAQGSLEEQLLHELNLILRKGDTLGSSSQPSSPDTPNPNCLPTHKSDFLAQPPCNSSPPSSQPLT